MKQWIKLSGFVFAVIVVALLLSMAVVAFFAKWMGL